mmetsp:Transcript_64888/g.119396  ORF Transcript_64888/g.119396 Transcript_64888/m.119396 type:complete len:572 (-) Transcript_64888:88-1803(-)
MVILFRHIGILLPMLIICTARALAAEDVAAEVQIPSDAPPECVGQACADKNSDTEAAWLIQTKSGVGKVVTRRSSASKTQSVEASQSVEAIGGFRTPGQEVALTLAAFSLFCAAWWAVAKSEADLSSYAPYVAEFVGTYALVFTVGCSVLTGDQEGTWNALAIASVLMVMVYNTGAISGGHLNPAVSLALFVADKMSWGTMLCYWAAQVLGGICAGFSYTLLMSHTGVNVYPKDEHCWTHAGIVEVIYTCTLAFVVLNVAAVEEKAGNWYFGLSIGFTVVAGGYAAGAISGAAFNPAVALGLDLSSYKVGIGYGFVWTLFELVGGVLAGLLFKAVRRKEEGGIVGKPTTAAKALSEFLGTFVLTLTVLLNIIVNSTGSTALSAAAALMAMIYALGDVSGAHFNPAVTLAIYLRGVIEPGQAVIYVAMQAGAAVCAGFLSTIFYDSPEKGFPELVPKMGYSDVGAGVIEMFFTTILAYTVLSTATCKTANQYFGLAIGFCVTVGGFAGGAVSGGELNPAVSIGVACASQSLGLSPLPMTMLVFIVFELSGGILADTLFRLTHCKEFETEKIG